MKMTETVRINAAPESVWKGLNHAETLRASIPGCESLEAIGDNAFEAKAGVKIGPLNASFKGKVTLSDLDPPNSYRITGEGSGGAAGFAKGSALVTLTPDGDGTLLTYDVDASVGGKLAQIGQRFIDQAAKKLSDDFFTKFSALVGAPAAAEERPAEGHAENPAADEPAKMPPAATPDKPAVAAATARKASFQPPPSHAAPAEPLAQRRPTPSAGGFSTMQKLSLIGIAVSLTLIAIGILWAAAEY